MNADQQRRNLRLVPKPDGAINADLVASTIMDFIDQRIPDLLPIARAPMRVALRNTIIRVVMAEDRNR